MVRLGGAQRAATGRVPRLVALAVGVTLGAGTLAACEPAPTVQAFAVTSTADAPDATPGDGSCAAADSECTLRAAVMEANASEATVDTTITLVAGETYALTIEGSGEEEGSAAGDLDVHTDVTIVGNGASIERFTLSANEGLLEHHAGRLLVEGASLSGTSASIGSGAIRNAADLQLVDVTISGSYALSKGTAIHQVGGSTLLRRTTVTGNGPFFSPASGFAAIWVESGGLVVVDSSITANWHSLQAVDTGSPSFSAIRQLSGDGIVISSTVSGHERGPTLVCTSVCGMAYWPGDGINADGTMEVVRSTLVGNRHDLTGTGSITVSGSVVDSCGTVPTSAGWNVESASSCGFAATGDVGGAGAVVGSLVSPPDAPGYHLPLVATAAVDAIPAGTPGLCDAGTPFDQRGAARPSGPACDVGAVERQPTD